jgi:Amt family ammonium transporter
VSERAIVSTIMLSLGTMAVISILFAVIGYSMCFGPSASTGGVIGDGSLAFLDFPDQERVNTHVPELSYMIFQCMFAVITPAVISGAVVTRIKYTYFMAFASLWHLLVYCPLAHWVWAPDGWLFKWGVLDFAGGTVVETASGVSAFILAFWLGRAPRGATRPPFAQAPPHNVPYILLGASLLWFGWLGFNGGSAISSGFLSGRSLVNTHLAGSVGLGVWNLLEILAGSDEGWFKGKATSVGAASGAIVGLVAITPGCGFVTPMWAMFIALFTCPVVFFGVRAIKASGVDDRLDVLGFHGISGMVGTALVGLFASKDAGSPADGAFYSGGGDLFSKQLAAISVTILLCVVGTTAIFWLLEIFARLIGSDIHIPVEHQKDIDASQHGEKAYFTALQALQRAANASAAPPADSYETENTKKGVSSGSAFSEAPSADAKSRPSGNGGSGSGSGSGSGRLTVVTVVPLTSATAEVPEPPAAAENKGE